MATSPNSVISETGRQLLRLHLTSDIGPIRIRKLLDHFGSVNAVCSASMSELEKVDRVGPKVARSLFQSRNDDVIEREIERASQLGIRIICWEDAEYPMLLKRITDPPACLYLRGKIEPTDAVAVAVVGSRRCSHYGAEQARRFGEGLARAGFTVVSGLARGVDSIAHRAALQAGGRTFAVLGNGLAQIYPPEHDRLAEDVAQAGALFSELKIDQAPEAANFPPRNRIIVGLALGVLVIEAGKRSGALISARLASEYNREAFALPGRVDMPQYSAGTNGLIRDSQAQLVTCLDDLLDGLAEVGRIMRQEIESISEPSSDVPRDTSGSGSSALPTDPTSTNQQRPPSSLSPDEHRVLQALSTDATDIESIQMQTGLDVSRVTSLLTMLQLKGAVKQLPGDQYVKRPSHLT